MIYLGNKKGQVAILMLFVVTIVLVIATLFVFFSSEAASPPSSGFSELIVGGRGNVESITDMAKLIAKESVTGGSSFYDIAAKRKPLSAAQIAPYGNFFKKIGDNEFSFGRGSGGKLNKLEVKGLFVEAAYGNNYEKKNFDLCMLFDGTGNYLKELELANEGFYKSYCGQLQV